MEPVSTRLLDADIAPDSTQADAPEEEAELSLVESAEQIFRYGRALVIPPPVETRTYPDGYTRRSPPQPYRIPEGYYRRIALKAALCAVAAVLLLILLAELMKRRILRF